MLLKLNIRACFVYASFSVPVCILMWLYVPETKGYAINHTLPNISYNHSIPEPLGRMYGKRLAKNYL